MKKSLYITFLAICLGSFSAIKAQETQTAVLPKPENIETLKAKREVVRLEDELLGKKIDLEKAKAEKMKLTQKSSDLNTQAQNIAPTTPEMADTKEAKNNAKIVKKAQSAVKDVDRNNDKIIDIEADIRKLESKLENARYSVEVREK